MTTKLLLAAGALASAHAILMPHKGSAISLRPVLPARAGKAVNTAAFSERDLKELLEKMCVLAVACHLTLFCPLVCESL